MNVKHERISRTKKQPRLLRFSKDIHSFIHFIAASKQTANIKKKEGSLLCVAKCKIGCNILNYLKDSQVDPFKCSEST